MVVGTMIGVEIPFLFKHMAGELVGFIQIPPKTLKI
jgi:hypothetical protein